MITQIECVPIVVSDQNRALKFYRDALGLEVTADNPTQFPDNRWITLKPRGAQTAVVLFKATAEQPEAASRLGKPTFILFDTDDIRADCERIESHGGRIVSGPEPAHWGEGKAMEAMAADPDGNGFVLVQPG